MEITKFIFYFFFLWVSNLAKKVHCLNFSSTSENILYARQQLRPILDKNINVSDCPIKSSKFLTIFHCDKYGVLMSNQDIIKPFTESVRYIINASLTYVEMHSDSALLISDENVFYVFHLNEKKEGLVYYYFTLKTLAFARIKDMTFFKYYGWMTITLLYKTRENSEFFLSFAINPENSKAFKESRFPLNFSRNSKMKMRLNKFSGNLEILLWNGKDKIILFESEKYEFSFKLKKETFLLSDFNITELKFNHDASFLVFSIIQNNSRTLYIYRKNDFLNEYQQTCDFSLSSLEKSKDEPLNFGFFDDCFDENMKKTMEFNYLLLAFYQRNQIYFYKMEEYSNTYGKIFCQLMEQKIILMENSTNSISNLGKHFSFLKFRNHSIKNWISYVGQNIEEFHEFVLLGHDDKTNLNFILVPFCQENEELIDGICSKCPFFSSGFQSSCFSCQPFVPISNLDSIPDFAALKKQYCNLRICTKDNIDSCIPCENLMEKLLIPKPTGAFWIGKSAPTADSPIPCEATCIDDNEILFMKNNQCLNRSEYRRLSNKCNSISDFYNCSSVPFCFWSTENECKQQENGETNLIIQNITHPNPAFCNFEMSFSQGIGALKFTGGNASVQQNHYCLFNLKHSNGDTNLEYYSLSIELLEKFIKDSDENSFSLEICTNEDVKGSCKLKPIYIDLSKSQKIVLVEQSVNIFVKIVFFKSLAVDFSKLHLQFSYKWVNFGNWHYRTPYIGLIAFLFVFFIVYVVKKALVCLSFQLRTNFCHVLSFNSIERKIKRLKRNKYIKKIKFVSVNNIDYDQKECSFCLENFAKSDNLFMISCKHVFHEKCFEVWINHNDENLKCPVCRRNLQKIDNARESDAALELSSIMTQ